MDRISIIDLDGTLIKGNSFTLYVRFCARRFPSVLPGLIMTVLARKLRMMSHFEAKCRIIRMTAPYFHGAVSDEFVKILKGRVRTRMLEVMSNSLRTYLATAAPMEYASPFGIALGFTEVFATDCSSGIECKGQDKVDALINGGVRMTDNVDVYTDHSDDIPLLKANALGSNYLVNPSSRTLCEVKKSDMEYRLL